MPLIDPAWLPHCEMKRVICHWTGGAHRASSLDRLHYHLLIEHDGNVIRGERSIADNVSTAGGVYAAHTKGCNAGSIGVAVCCMAGANERPFRAGSHPMTERQWTVLAEVVAELCGRYAIPVTPETVLGHGEVQLNLGIAQNGKWDPLILPWNQQLGSAEVGKFLRSLVQRALAGGEDPEAPQMVNVTFRGKPIGKAALMNGECFVDSAEVAGVLGCTVEGSEGRLRFVGLRAPEGSFEALDRDGRLYIDIQDVAFRAGHTAAWDAPSATVIVT